MKDTDKKIDPIHEVVEKILGHAVLQAFDVCRLHGGEHWKITSSIAMMASRIVGAYTAMTKDVLFASRCKVDHMTVFKEQLEKLKQEAYDVTLETLREARAKEPHG